MNDKIDFTALAGALLDRAEAVVAEWLPSGKKRGTEWVCGDLSGSAGRSTSVNLVTGRWAEFSDGGESGNDLTSLYAAIHGLGNAQAARDLIDRYGFGFCLLVQVSAPAYAARPQAARAAADQRPELGPDATPAAKPAASKSDWVPVIPVPANAPAPTFKHWHYPAPVASWAYRFNGDLYGYIVRYAKSDGGKEIMPHTWCTDTGDGRGLMRWHFKQWDEPRPLYVPAGVLHDRRPVVLVEGEKCAQAGFELLGDEFDFVSWPGGAKAWQKASWGWLSGVEVILWPDADAKRERLSKAEVTAGLDPESKPLMVLERQPGYAAMAGIGALLQAQQGCTVKMVPMPRVGSVSDGWDLADAIEQASAAGDAAARVRAFIADARAFEIGTNEALRATAAGVETASAAARDPGAGASVLERSAGWTKALLWSGGGVAKVRENVVLALDGTDLPGGLRLAGVAEAEGVIAFNSFSNQVVKLKASPWGTPAGVWQEQDELEMGHWLTRVHGLPSMPRNTLEEAVLMVSQRHVYHPVRARLDTLRGQWDGDKRLGTWLKRICAGEAAADLDAVAVVRRDQYLARVGTWLVMAMVARVMSPGCKYDYMVILEGAQGLGKSTLAHMLGGEWFADTGLQLGEKDSYQNLQGVWVYEMGELDALSRSEVTKVKNFISSQKDRFRASFDKRPKDYPRQCVFIGTTNEDHYLVDPTGNRRMWPVPVTKQVDIATLRDELEQMFAEALTYYEAGERYHPTPAEQRQLFESEQAHRTVENAIEAAITTYLYDDTQKIGLQGQNGTLIDAISLIVLLSAIGIGLEKLTPGRFHEKQAAAALRKLGWLEKRSSEEGRPRVYVRPKPADVAAAAVLAAMGSAAGLGQGRASVAGGCPV